MSAEKEIRNLIVNWVDAIRERDIDAILKNHTDDIVMFDVPPPERGARGMTAYRETWPPFLDWIASGAVFEIDELDVTASGDAGFAWALLRCGKPEYLEENPERRLRLTLGLRREAQTWKVSHEHHSFTIEPG